MSTINNEIVYRETVEYTADDIKRMISEAYKKFVNKPCDNHTLSALKFEFDNIRHLAINYNIDVCEIWPIVLKSSEAIYYFTADGEIVKRHATGMYEYIYHHIRRRFTDGPIC